MSYECVKRITLNKEKGTINVCSACNNVTPKIYSTWEYKTDYTDFNDKLFMLFLDLENGNLKITTLNKNTENYEFALVKVYREMAERKVDSYNLYEKSRNDYTREKWKLAKINFTENDIEQNTYAKHKEFNTWLEKQGEKEKAELDKLWLKILYNIYGEYFEIFKDMVFTDIKGDYKLSLNNEYYVTKVGNFGKYGFSKIYYNDKYVYNFVSGETKERNDFLRVSYKRAVIIQNQFRQLAIENIM